MFVLILLVSFFALSCSKDRPAPLAPAGKSQAAQAAPAVPTNLRFDDPTDSSCRVRWDASDGANDYNVRYRPTVGGRWTSEPHGGRRIHNNILDLEPGTEYSWAVRAINSSGVSGWALGPNFTTLPEGETMPPGSPESDLDGALPESETMPPGSPESDRAALEEFYWHLFGDNSGPNGTLTENHWLSRSTLAKWYGVKVNEEGRVVELAFDNYDSAIWHSPRLPEEGWRVKAISEKALIALTRLTELRRLELYHGYLDASPLPAIYKSSNILTYAATSLKGNPSRKRSAI